MTFISLIAYSGTLSLFHSLVSTYVLEIKYLSYFEMYRIFLFLEIFITSVLTGDDDFKHDFARLVCCREYKYYRWKVTFKEGEQKKTK